MTGELSHNKSSELFSRGFLFARGPFHLHLCDARTELNFITFSTSHFSEFILKGFVFIYVCLYACVCMSIHAHVCADVLGDQKKVLGAAVMGVCELHLVGAVMHVMWVLRFL